MSSSPIGTTWIDAVNAPIKSNRTLGFFRANTASEFHQYILDKFLNYQRETGITKAQFAASIQKDAGQLNRLLGAPGNWTLETISDLLLGMGERIKPASVAISRVRRPVTEPSAGTVPRLTLIPQTQPKIIDIPSSRTGTNG